MLSVVAFRSCGVTVCAGLRLFFLRMFAIIFLKDISDVEIIFFGAVGRLFFYAQAVEIRLNVGGVGDVEFLQEEILLAGIDDEPCVVGVDS